MPHARCSVPPDTLADAPGVPGPSRHQDSPRGPVPRPAGSRLRALRPGDIRGTCCSDHLDMIRGVAALAVLWTHARGCLLHNFDDRIRGNSLLVLLYLLSNFGHSAVIVFFVLSGYFIGSSVIRQVGSEEWSWTSYLTKRLIRLYIVLIPALVLTALCDRTWMSLSAGQDLDAQGADVTPENVAPRLSVAVFVGNLLFLQDILVPWFGSNGPLWSLSYEFWYYMIFPCGWLALASRGPGWTRLLHAALAASLLAFVGRQVAIGLLYWLMGASVCLAPPLRVGRAARTILLTASSSCFLATLAMIGLRKIPGPVASDSLLALTFTAVLYALLQDRLASRSGWYSRLAAALAGFSYTLYLLHLPVLHVFRSMFTYETLWHPDLLHLAYCGIILMSTLLICYGISRLTEARTEQVRGLLFERRPRRRNGPTAEVIHADGRAGPGHGRPAEPGR